MFYFVVYSSQFIRKMKSYGIAVSYREFVNSVSYRKNMLDEALRLNDKEAHHLAREIRALEWALI